MTGDGPIDYLTRLEEALRKFGAQEITDITEQYAYYPDYVNAKLGAGSYGEAFRMKSIRNPSEPLRVVKIIPKARVSKNALQIQHLAAELAVTGFFHHANLNKRVGLAMSPANVYLVLELVEGSKPDAASRLAYLFATHNPRRLADFDSFMAQLEADATAAGHSTVGSYLDKSGRMRTILAECGVKREVPTSSDLFGLIVAMKRVPDGLARIITKQALSGLNNLHENNVVHRDIKTENLVVGIDREVALLRDANGKITGARVTEKVQAKLIDFGLVKYMRLGSFPNVISPGMFDPTKPTQSVAGLGNANPADLAFDDDDDDEPAKNPQQQQQQQQVPPQLAAAFPVAVTPCGTELYCSLEVITGIIDSGVGKSKWMSDSAHLPKMDVYGAGTMLFCCANGRPPFRPPRDQYRPVGREERIKQVQRLVAAGPVFSNGVPTDVQNFVRLLMDNDPNARPTAAEALRHPFLASVTGNAYVYDVLLDGTVTPVGYTSTTATSTAPTDTATPAKTETSSGSSSAAPVAPNNTGNAPQQEEEDDAQDVAFENDLAAALRKREDAGDDRGKNDDDTEVPATEAPAQ